MQNYHQKEAIQNAKRMIKAFFIEKNIDKVFSYINPKNFTWIGPGENEILTNIDDIRKHFQDYCNIVTSAYKIISEEYILGASSSDTCIVIAKIFFKGMKDRQYFRSGLHFSFYFQLIDDKMLVSHYQVNIPIKKPNIDNAAQFMINKNANPDLLIKMDLQYQSSLLKSFFDTKHMAMKSFCYESDFPYCYVNQAFLTLFGYSELQNFISQGNFSSLAHIHPDDQQRYINHLSACFPKHLILNTSQEWQWHASYHIVYRTQSFDNVEKIAFEWGNLITLNGHPIVNSFVLPIENNSLYPPPINYKSPCTASTMGSSDKISTLLDDCGIHIGNIMVIYPKYHKLLIRDKIVDLTPIEFNLLLILSNNINKAVDPEEFYDDVWNDSELKDTSFTLKTHISNLRRKLKAASEDTIKLMHIKDQGYCLTIPQF